MRLIFRFLIVGFATLDVFAEESDCDGGDKGHWRFAGCVWSMNECTYSCPTRAARKVEEDPSRCPDAGIDLACYCWEESEGAAAE